MSRIETGPGTRSRAGKRLAGVSIAAIAALASACLAGPITVDASDARALTRATTVHVTVIPDAGGQADSAVAGPGTASSDTTAPRAAADEGRLRAEAENALRARGYAIGG
jgi:hypothetical protein